MNCQIERWPAIESEVLGLIGPHWEEIALDRDRIPLDIDVPMYRNLDSENVLVVATLRDAGRLVGYLGAYVKTHLHYKSTLFGFMDAFFLLPEFRKGPNGLLLFTTMEAEMRRRGVKSQIFSSKKHFDLTPMFEYLGWDTVGLLHQKWIGD